MNMRAVLLIGIESQRALGMLLSDIEVVLSVARAVSLSSFLALIY